MSTYIEWHSFLNLEGKSGLYVWLETWVVECKQVNNMSGGISQKIGTDHGRLLSNIKGANCLLVDSQSYLDVILSIRKLNISTNWFTVKLYLLQA